jgi:hypothetical protein
VTQPQSEEHTTLIPPRPGRAPKRPTGELLALMCGILVLMLIAYVLISTLLSYQGRIDIVKSNRAACVRGMTSKIDTANSNWVIAEAVDGTAKTPTALLIEKDEMKLAIDDAKGVIPSLASQLPQPLQKYAHFSCSAVYPSAKFFG